MKYSWILFLGSLLLMACSDAVDLSPKNTIPNTVASGASQLDIGPVNPYVWTSLSVPTIDGPPFVEPESRMMILPVNEQHIYCIMGGLFRFVHKLNITNKRWERIQNNIYIPFAVGHQYLFSYQSKIFYGINLDNEMDERSIGSLNPVTGEHELLPEFPGTPVYNPTCFVLGDKAYIMGGQTGNGGVANQCWEYNFTTQQWTNKGSMPGGARYGGTAVVRNNKVYLGLGYEIINFNGQPIKHHKKDWQLITPGSPWSATLAEFPGEFRTLAKSFIINDKIYVGLGDGNGNGTLADLWEYNPETNKWARKTSCPADPDNLKDIGVFSIGNAGYLVAGRLNEFWRYSNTSLVPTNP
jgi:hypothetical protein